MSNPKFRVAIGGGGIGGLTFAIALTKYMKDYDQHIQIDIYEAAKEFTEIGAGVGVFRRPLRILQAIGVKDELEPLTHIPADDEDISFMMFRKSDQTEGFSFHDMHIPVGMAEFHRSEFQKALIKHLDASVVTSHLKKRLISYTKPSSSSKDGPNPITLQFKDGTTATCDVLIGADGIHSATREQMFKDIAEEMKGQDPSRAKAILGMKDPVWSGTVAYRGLIPKEKLEAIAPGHRALTRLLNYMGKNKHVIVFPISGGHLVNVVAFCSEPEKEGTVFEGHMVEQRPAQEMLDQYKGWETELLQLLQCIENPSRWTINRLRGLPTYSHGRVAILGDAAHAMTPNQGSGAGQAIDDAYILASLIAHPLTTLQTLPTALEIYDGIRRPLGNDVIERSSKSGHLYEFSNAEFGDLVNQTTYQTKDTVVMQRWQKLGYAMTDIWKWAWTTDAKMDRDRAIEMLEKRLKAN